LFAWLFVDFAIAHSENRNAFDRYFDSFFLLTRCVFLNLFTVNTLAS
jgi:hypothetical protein